MKMPTKHTVALKNIYKIKKFLFSAMISLIIMNSVTQKKSLKILVY